MPLLRFLVCATAVLAALTVADVAMADAGTPAPTGAYVTCTTPVTTDGAVQISSARAVRGTTAAPAGPDETCTVAG